MNRVDTDRLKELIDNRSLYSPYFPGTSFNGKSNTKVKCPFHDDKTPSFTLYLDTGRFQCYGTCGVNGDAIEFIEKKEGLDFKSAVKKIMEDQGITEEQVSLTSESKKGKPPTPPKKEQTKPKEEASFPGTKEVEKARQQLLRNKDVLRKLKAERGFNDETIKKQRIGYQNQKIIIPIEQGQGKWNLKQHKGYQTKGAKAVLYPSGITKKAREEKSPLLIAGGEFKALLLNQKGFHAVCGTGGEGTFKKEWIEEFRGLDVILVFDNDDAGKAGAKKAGDYLLGTAKSVKTVLWPDCMDSRKKKDVTDYFVTLGRTTKDFQKLLDRAIDARAVLKEIFGIKFIQPGTYIVEEGNVKREVHDKSPITITHSPVLITGRAIDVEQHTEELEISFRRDGQWREKWIPRKSAFNSQKIMELADEGVCVNSRNSGKLVDYLADFEASNLNLMRKTIVARGLGYKEHKGKKFFVLSPKANGKLKSDESTIEFIPEAGFERFTKALQPQGKYFKWIETVEPTLEHPLAVFAFCASFAAPLLKILKAPNFIIDFWGETSLGKTTVLELASSVWGNPHKETGGLIFSWDSTRVYLERMASFFGDFPIFPDESQTVDDNILTKILYQVANGVGKGRGAIAGVRHTESWHTVCFSTGERSLADCTTFSGARARTIPIHGSPFPNAGGEFIRNLKEGLYSNYGHAGPRYMDVVLPIWQDKEKTKKLREEYKWYQGKLSQEANSEIGDRFSHYFATVLVAGDLVKKNLDIGKGCDFEESTYRAFKSLINDSEQQADLATRAMEHVLSWADGNESSFNGKVFDSPGVWRPGECIGILPHKLTEILRKEEYPYRAVLKGWEVRGWIRTNGKNKSWPLEYLQDGKPKQKRFIYIHWKIVESFFRK